MCSLVFKIVHHPQKGALCFVRVYAGRLSRHQASVYNINRSLTEKFTKLMVAFADDYREVEEVTAGNIAVLSGLKVSGEIGVRQHVPYSLTFVIRRIGITKINKKRFRQYLVIYALRVPFLIPISLIQAVLQNQRRKQAFLTGIGANFWVAVGSGSYLPKKTGCC